MIINNETVKKVFERNLKYIIMKGIFYRCSFYINK